MVTLHSVFNLPGRHWRRKHASWLGSRWLSLSRAAFFDQVHKLQKDGLRKAWIPFTLFLSWYVFQKHALDSAFFFLSAVFLETSLSEPLVPPAIREVPGTNPQLDWPDTQGNRKGPDKSASYSYKVVISEGWSYLFSPWLSIWIFWGTFKQIPVSWPLSRDSDLICSGWGPEIGIC